MSQQAYMTVAMMSRFCFVINCGRRMLRPGLLHYRNHSDDLQATTSLSNYHSLCGSCSSSGIWLDDLPDLRPTSPASAVARNSMAPRHGSIESLSAFSQTSHLTNMDDLRRFSVHSRQRTWSGNRNIRPRYVDHDVASRNNRHYQKMMKMSPICIKVGVQDQFSTTS